MILVGIAVLMAVRLIYSRPVGGGDDQVRLALHVIGWVLVAVGLLSLWQMFTGPLFGVLYWIVAVVAAGHMASRYQQSEKTALLWVMSIAAERQMPLVPTIEAFAREWGGVFGRRVQLLAAALRAGVPLPDALDRQPALLPGDVRISARIGVESGMLGPALREAVLTRTTREPVWQSVASKAYYLLVVLFLAQLVTAFTAYHTAPRLGMIWGMFGATQPPLTEWLFDQLSNPALFSLLVTALGIQLALLIYLLLHYLGWAPWELPLVSRLLRRLDTALMLRSLALMVERQRPISTAMLAVAQSYHKAWLRRRLRRADLHLSNGVDWCTALHREGLLSAHEAALLASAERVGNLPWAMRAVAESGERRLMHRLQSVVLVVYPLIIVVLGAFVLLFAAAMLVPLFQLIEGLTPWQAN